MAKEIYGVDIDAPFTAENVRDAIIRCFTVAHNEVLEETMFCDMRGDCPPEEEVEKLKQLDVRMLIGQMFAKVGADFDHPTKASLWAVAKELQAYAANFRNQEIIGKHAAEIGVLLEKLPE
jgi:hypothetical protein